MLTTAIAYQIHAITGNVESDELKKRVRKYAPEKMRLKRHISYANLYAGIIDCCQEQFAFTPSDQARFIFQNDYIYNDSRMEGVDVTQEEAAEIVTDLRLNAQNSEYCTETNEAFLSIAGHYCMYQEILSVPVSDKLDVYDLFDLNRKLFSKYPFPEVGGMVRQNNALALGAKFETADYQDIFPELDKLNEVVQDYFARRGELSKSEYIKQVVRTHHRITVIHPFQDGNGRTSRAFMNVEFVRAGMPPIYIRAEEKNRYFDALARADLTGEYDELYEIVFDLILKACVELNR